MKRYKNTPYLVSDNGDVYREGAKKPLKHDISIKGYRRVTFCIDGKTKRYLVHHLVGHIYIPNPEKAEYINHIDNNPNNNCVENLEWCNHSENMKHSHKQGRCSNIIASKVASAIAYDNAVVEIREIMWERFLEITSVKKRYYIKYICSGCNNIYTHRKDSPSIKRGGICRACFVKKKI